MAKDDKDIRAVAADALEDAADALKKADDAINKAEALTEKVEVAFGDGSWQSAAKELGDLAKKVAAGESLVSKETLVGIVKDVIDMQEADRKAKGILFGGGSLEDKRVSMLDPWKKGFDHASFMYRTGRWDKKTKEVDLLNLAFLAPPMTDTERAFQHAYTDLMIADQVLRAQEKHNYRGFRDRLPKMTALCDEMRRAMLSEIKSQPGTPYVTTVDPNDTYDTGNWVPTVFSSEFRETLWLEMRVEALFETIPASGPGSSFELPWDATDYVADRVPAAAGGSEMGATFPMSNPFQASNPIQLGLTLDDQRASLVYQMHRGRAMYQGVLDEDAIIAMMPRMRTQILRSLAKGAEQAIINGQDNYTGEGSTLPMDTATTGTWVLAQAGPLWSALAPFDVRYGTLGLRKRARAQTGTTVSLGGGTNILTATACIRTIPKLMGKYGINPSQKAIIVPPVGYIHLLTDTNVITAEKFGPQATIFTGALAAVGGAPIIVSEFSRQDLNASGIYDNSTTTTYSAHVVHRPSFINVEKRAISIGADYYRATDVTDVIAMRRWQFGCIFGDDTASGRAQTVVAEGYNAITAQ